MAIAFVTSANARGAAVNSLAVVVNGVTAGNALFGAWSNWVNPGAPATPTSSPSNTWAIDVQQAIVDGDAVLCSALNVASGNTTVTFDSGTGFYAVASVSEFSGIVTSAALDRTTSNSATSTTPSSGNTAATTQADELVIAVVCEITGADTNNGLDVPATTGYTNIHVERDSNTYIGHSSDYKIVSSTGAQSAAWGTMDGSYEWVCAIATYKAAAGGAATSYPFRPAGRLISNLICQ